jgi:hypothetical protein
MLLEYECFHADVELSDGDIYGRCDIWTPDTLWGPQDHYFALRGDWIEGLSDAQLVELVRSAQKVGSHLYHVRRLEEIVSHLDRQGQSLQTLAEFQDEYRASVEYLTAHVEIHDDPKIIGLVGNLERLIDGSYERTGYVYCISDQLGHYKIGFSKVLDRRIKQLATQPPFELELIHSHLVFDMVAYESAFHHTYRQKRLKGEWFSLSEKDIEAFKTQEWRTHYWREKFNTNQ